MNNSLRFHPLSLLVCTLTVPMVLLVANDLGRVFVFLLMSSGVLLVYRRYLRLIKYLAVFIVFFGINAIVSQSSNEFLLLYVGMMGFMVTRLLPVMMIGSVLSTDVKPGEFISALQQLKLPNGLILSFIVALRFLHLYTRELQMIKTSLGMRGIKLSILQPIKALEYLLVPVLFRGSAIAEEMSAAAITKAIEAPVKRSSLYCLKWKAIDFLLLAATVFTGLSCVIGR